MIIHNRYERNGGLILFHADLLENSCVMLSLCWVDNSGNHYHVCCICRVGKEWTSTVGEGAALFGAFDGQGFLGTCLAVSWAYIAGKAGFLPIAKSYSPKATNSI